MGKYLTIKEVAAVFQVHEKTVARAIRLGRLKSVKFGGLRRITPEALTAYMDGQGCDLVVESGLPVGAVRRSTC